MGKWVGNLVGECWDGEQEQLVGDGWDGEQEEEVVDEWVTCEKEEGEHGWATPPFEDEHGCATPPFEDDTAMLTPPFEDEGDDGTDVKDGGSARSEHSHSASSARLTRAEMLAQCGPYDEAARAEIYRKYQSNGTRKRGTTRRGGKKVQMWRASMQEDIEATRAFVRVVRGEGTRADAKFAKEIFSGQLVNACVHGLVDECDL